MMRNDGQVNTKAGFLELPKRDAFSRFVKKNVVDMRRQKKKAGGCRSLDWVRAQQSYRRVRNSPADLSLKTNCKACPVRHIEDGRL